MIRTSVLLLLLFSVMSAVAENKPCVLVHQVSGITAFVLDNNPTITFEGKNIKLVSKDIEVAYELDKYLKVTIENYEVGETDAVEGVKVSDQFNISNQEVILGVTEDKKTFVYTIDGKEVKSTASNRVLIQDLPKGIYVIANGNKKIKIYKK